MGDIELQNMSSSGDKYDIVIYDGVLLYSIEGIPDNDIDYYILKIENLELAFISYRQAFVAKSVPGFQYGAQFIELESKELAKKREDYSQGIYIKKPDQIDQIINKFGLKNRDHYIGRFMVMSPRIGYGSPMFE